MSDKSKLFIWYPVVSILFFIFTFRFSAIPITPGLDASYALAFNYFFHKGTEIGKDIFFTFGPWGFLLFPQPIGRNIFIGNIFRLFLFLSFSLCYFYLVFISNILRKDNLFDILIILLISVMIGNLVLSLNIGHILFSILLCILLISDRKYNFNYLILAFVISWISFLIKPAFGIISLSTVFAYIFIKNFSKRKISFFLLIYAVLTLVVLWTISGGTPEALKGYLISTLEFSRGNSSAMALGAEIHWLLFIAALLLFLKHCLLGKIPFCLTIPFLIALSIWYKYAISRADHLLEFIYIFSVISFISLFKIPELRRFILSLFIILISIIFLRGSLNNVGFDHIKNFSLSTYLLSSIRFDGLKNMEHIYKINQTEAILKQVSDDTLKDLILSNEIRSELGNSTVDIYPWEVAYAYANKLNWNPRPVFQSYIAYTPWLDSKNAAFFRKENAPAYLLWEKRNGATGSIDGRYLFNDEPLTVFQMIRNYHISRSADQVALLKRNACPAFAEPVVTKKTEATWEDWVPVPIRPENIVRARIRFKRTWYGTLKRNLYREKAIFIEYRLKTGEEKKYRIVPDNAVSGLWVSPHIGEDHFANSDTAGPQGGPPGSSSYEKKWNCGTPVVAIRFLKGEEKVFTPSFHIEWEEISPIGKQAGSNR